MRKEEAKKLKRGDYIPPGPRERIYFEELKNWSFRETGEFEILQCNQPVGSDIQSGPIYCGEIVDYVFMSSDRKWRSELCKRHAAPVLKIIRKARNEQEAIDSSEKDESVSG